MPNEAVVLDVDGSQLVDRVLGEVDGTVFTVVEYDQDEFNVLHLDDATRNFYRNEEQMMDHFAEIHSYVHIDFVELDLFTEQLFPIAEEVEYIATRMDYMKLVRFYGGDRGLFVSLEPDEAVAGIAAAVRDELS